VKWLAKAMGRAPKAKNLLKAMSPQSLKGIKPLGGKFGQKAFQSVDDFGKGLREVPEDLNAFGNKSAPRAPRSGKDIFPDSAGDVGPELPPLPNGASTFGDPNLAPLSGHYHTLPKGTILPEGLGVLPDGKDVIPNSPHGPTHHTIFPTEKMHIDRFIELFMNLPWRYGGKK